MLILHALFLRIFYYKINEKSFSITITKFFMKNVQCSLIFD